MNETKKNATITTEDAKEKPYNFRKLNATDIAPMCKVLSKIGIKKFATCLQSESVVSIISQKDENEDSDNTKINKAVGIQVMIEIADIILANIPYCEKDIFTLLSNVSGLTVDEIREFDLATFAEMVFDFVKKEEFKDFIKVVSKLFK